MYGAIIFIMTKVIADFMHGWMPLDELVPNVFFFTSCIVSLFLLPFLYSHRKFSKSYLLLIFLGGRPL